MSTITLHPTAFSESPFARVRRPSAHLTRRGRAAVFVVALLIVFAAALFAASGSGASGDKGAPVSTRSVLVTPGDTLWDLSSEAAGSDESVRDMQQRIVELNGLDDVVIYAGQRLRIPTD